MEDLQRLPSYRRAAHNRQPQPPARELAPLAVPRARSLPPRPPPPVAAQELATTTASYLQGRAGGRGAAAIIADARQQLERVHASRLPANAEWRRQYDQRQAELGAEQRRRTELLAAISAEVAALADAIPSTAGGSERREPVRLPVADALDATGVPTEHYLQQLVSQLNQHRADMRDSARELTKELADERARAEASEAEHVRTEAALRAEIAELKSGGAGGTAVSSPAASPREGPDDSLLIRWLESGGTELLVETAGYGAAAASKSRDTDVDPAVLLEAASAAIRNEDALPGTGMLHAVVQAVVDATLASVAPVGGAVGYTEVSYDRDDPDPFWVESQDEDVRQSPTCRHLSFADPCLRVASAVG